MAQLPKKPILPKKQKGRPKYVYLDKFERVTKDLEAQIKEKNDTSLIGIISTIAIFLSIISIIVTIFNY